MELKTSSLKCLFTLLIITVISPLQADNLSGNQTLHSNTATPEEATFLRIIQLSDEINTIRTSITDIDHQIEFSTYEEKLIKFKELKIQKTKILNDRLLVFEQVATGIIDPSNFNKSQNNEFSWHEELKEIFKPIVYELKKLTERPRQIDRLRTEIESLALQQEIAQSAINKIQTLENNFDDSEINTNLSNLEQQWQSQLDEISSNLQLLSIQLNKILENGGSHRVEVVILIKEFFSGRGLNLVLAVLAFSLTLLTLRFFSHHLEQFISRGRDRERRFFSRLVHVVFLSHRLSGLYRG